jgi:mono/diheme cytochrome c family protein
MEEIFPPGHGRDLVLNNCQNCHTFVPIVVLQMEKDAWQRNSIDHRERVTQLTEDEFRIVYEYLSTNFGPHRPVPELPKALLETWTSY